MFRNFEYCILELKLWLLYPERWSQSQGSTIKGNPFIFIVCWSSSQIFFGVYCMIILVYLVRQTIFFITNSLAIYIFPLWKGPSHPSNSRLSIGQLKKQKQKQKEEEKSMFLMQWAWGWFLTPAVSMEVLEWLGIFFHCPFFKYYFFWLQNKLWYSKGPLSGLICK